MTKWLNLGEISILNTELIIKIIKFYFHFLEILWRHTSSHRLTWTVISIGSKARLEPKIKGEGGFWFFSGANIHKISFGYIILGEKI